MTTSPWAWTPTPPSRLEQPVHLLRLTGGGTRRFLHGQTSAAIEQASPGSWVPTCCISPTGRMRAMAEVLLDDQGAWLVITAGDAAAVRQALDRVLFPADRVALGALEPALLVSPVETSAPAAAGVPGPGRWRDLSGGGGWWLGAQALLRQGPDGSTALPPELAERPVLDPAGQERWRIQQGVAAAPGELNDDTNPFELGLADRVSLSKGCYVGQETLAKLATYDGVKQQLRRWCWTPPDGAPPPEPGQVLVAAEAPGGGRLGTVTSVHRLADGRWIGLALVRRQALDAAELQLGPDPGGPRLQLSIPPAFVAPPVGAGAQASP